MPNIRSIRKDELDKFISIDKDQNPEKLKKIIRGLMDRRETSFRYLFVAEKNGEFIARILYFSPLGNPKDLSTFALSIPWAAENYLKTGTKLLEESLLKLKEDGVMQVEHRVDSDYRHLEKTKALMGALNIPLIQEKKGMFYRKDEIPQVPGRLKFRSITETGEEEFIEAIECVTRETLDKVDLLSIEKYGERQAALNYFNGLRHIDFRPEMWLLAYDETGRGAGLVVAQQFDGETGAINYIGVFPEQRGHGYVKDLIAKSTAILKKVGVKRIIADIDKENFPMENGLTKAGYVKESEFLVFVGYLEDILRESVVM